MSKLSKAAFHSEPQAFEYLEKTLWPDGAVCPHCGVVGNATKLQGKATRIGVWKCNDCRKQFTVKVGTVFEHGRIPLHKMLQAVYLLCCSKKGCSSHQLHRVLGIAYKTACDPSASASVRAMRTREARSHGRPGRHRRGGRDLHRTSLEASPRSSSHRRRAQERRPDAG